MQRGGAGAAEGDGGLDSQGGGHLVHLHCFNFCTLTLLYCNCVQGAGGGVQHVPGQRVAPGRVAQRSPGGHASSSQLWCRAGGVKPSNLDLEISNRDVALLCSAQDDIVLILHMDRKDHLLMNYAQQFDRLPIGEQENLALLVLSSLPLAKAEIYFLLK